MRKFIFLTLLIATSCGLKTSDEIDSEAVNKEIKSRKIKRLKEGEIMESAFNQGKRIIEKLDTQLGNQASDCEKEVSSLLAEKDKSLVLNARITCTLATDAGEKETMVWEAYQYNLEQNLPFEDNLQKLGGDELLYSHPIILKDSAQKEQLVVLRLVLSKREVIRRF